MGYEELLSQKSSYWLSGLPAPDHAEKGAIFLLREEIRQGFAGGVVLKPSASPPLITSA